MRVRRNSKQATLALSSLTTRWDLLPEPVRKEAIKLLGLLIEQNWLAKKGEHHDGKNH